MSSDADNIVSLYERHAQAYDRLRGRSLFEKSWLDSFIDLDTCTIGFRQYHAAKTHTDRFAHP